MKASKKSGERAAKADLTPRKSKDVKGGATKASATPKSTAIEIQDYGFGVAMPVTTS